MEYKKTIKLPKTAFPMRANLAQKEPELLKAWQKRSLYSEILKARGSKAAFCFHDGPPYANGHLHYGTVFNKILKDIVIKQQLISGNFVNFVPGWDCHGLPIELNVERAMGKDKAREVPKASLRKACRKEAEKWIKVQRNEFERLGVFAQWDEPYLTMQPRYEKGIMQVLRACVNEGAIERGKKPVYWCGSCQTALAEAEVEYDDHESPSIYVRFPFEGSERNVLLKKFKLNDTPAHKRISAVIWTTTPWTLPANLAIALHPDFQYQLYDLGDELVLLASELSHAVLKASKKEGQGIANTLKGRELEGLIPRHPFIDRGSPFLLADYVTLEAGTGLVHTAPGHGADDYILGSKHGLEPYAPVNQEARFTDEAPEAWRGMQVHEANPLIVDFLSEQGHLLNPNGQTLAHSYPHCWRCKKPVIFRATTQWFILMDKPLKSSKKSLRELALSSIKEVNWVPKWGYDRIHGMLADRPDWCISRQRSWGVPIPAFHCKACEHAELSDTVMKHMIGIVEKHGVDIWYEKEVEELLPPGLKCPSCGASDWQKDQSILDVWFESGSSFHAVLASGNYGEGLSVPADMYLEGSDQHRGWFHSALLLGAIMNGKAPYKTVLTHGFVCDDKGRPYSKSEIRRRAEAGEKIEYIEPEKIIKQRGAEMLRAWASSQDYRSDPRYSEEHLEQVSESYFRIRNTLRFLLGNLDGYLPSTQSIELDPLDAWARARMRQYLIEMTKAYAEYDFRKVFQSTVELCAGDWSAYYLDVIKDRLYCDAEDSPRRKSTLATLAFITEGTLAVLAPILCFTADEAFRYLPGKDQNSSVFLEGKLETIEAQAGDAALLDAAKVLNKLRLAVNAAMEPLIKDKSLAHRREAAVKASVSEAEAKAIKMVSAELAETLAVASVELSVGEQMQASVSKTDDKRCERCWRHRPEVGKVHPELCTRCKEVIKA
ncbi:MAG: isoleucine--tRNA ligase [Myxococcales bacterium]|nr:MAG: isoleucine--tRNA ligase [Myxococcales bacterium]